MKPTLSAVAVSRSIELADGAAPEWVELLPAGPEIEGRDGRKWRLDDAAVVAAASQDSSKDIPIDYEHATEIKAPEGDPAPAAGWIKELQARGGSLWGKVEWTERGGAMVAAKEYRYLSPVFLHSKESPQRIMQLLSAGLTNSPNLRMTALNREEEDMHISTEISTALGLAEDATDEQVVTAINTLKTERDSARNKEILKALGLAEDATGEQAVAAVNKLKTDHTPSLDEFVPRADYDQAVAKVAKATKEAQENEIEAEITKALEAGKITPATKEYHVEQCKAEGGLERFRKYVEAAPEVARNTNLGGTPSGKGADLTGDAAKMASMFGHKAEDLKKYR